VLRPLPHLLTAALLPLLALLTSAGCASTLTTHQTARTLAPGKLRVSAATGLHVPGGTLLQVAAEAGALAQAARAAAEGGEPLALTPEQADRLLTAGVSLAVAPPGVSNELMARVGLLERLDAGLRLSSTSLRLDGKVQLLHLAERGAEGEAGAQGAGAVPASGGARRSFDVAVGLGVSRQLFRGVLFDALSLAQAGDVSRWDLEVPVYVSADFGDVLKLYGAPKYVYSHTRLDARLLATLEQGSSLSGADLRLPPVVTGHFFGASAGLALGYRWVHAFAELTAGHTFVRARVLGAPRELGGLTLLPSVGLAVQTE
jgi:hypothetical protein